MFKITDYLNYAEECRKLAKLAADPQQSATLLAMAQTWTDLAAARQEEIKRKARLEKLENGTEA